MLIDKGYLVYAGALIGKLMSNKVWDDNRKEEIFLKMMSKIKTSNKTNENLVFDIDA